MFRLNLVLRRKNDDILIFSPAPWFRILFLFLAAIIITGIVTVAAEDPGGNFILPIIISACCLLAAMYEESWTFNKKEQHITFRTGLIIFNKSAVYRFNEVQNLELAVFLRGAESDGKADHEINLNRPFSRENTGEVSGRGPKIIHPKYHQEIKLVLKSGKTSTIESIDSRGTEALSSKAAVLSDFTGIGLIK